MAKKTNHYVDNKRLQAALVQYKNDLVNAEKNGTEPPRIPEYVGECILFIANRLAMKANFVNYTFKEEMINDGIENCICYLNNYDPFKYNNPFAYITQIIFYAFLRRIAKEKKQLYVKQKMLHNCYLHGMLEESGDGANELRSAIDIDNVYMSNLVEDFESKLSERKKKKGKTKKEKVEE